MPGPTRATPDGCWAGLAEISERRFVSRRTVKSQAIAVYRKLGATSRGQAVERARQLGLLDA